MQKITLFIKQLRLKQVLMAIFTGVILLLNTACNSGTVQGARPNNPPVQMGGNNNPHKGGGDGYTNYKMSPDPTVKSSQSTSKQRAETIAASERLIADTSIKSNAADLLYPGENTSETDQPAIGSRSQTTLPDLPEPKQPVVDRSDPETKILERVGTAFKDASAFLKDTADSASTRPELKSNPALGQ